MCGGGNMLLTKRWRSTIDGNVNITNKLEYRTIHYMEVNYYDI